MEGAKALCDRYTKLDHVWDIHRMGTVEKDTDECCNYLNEQTRRSEHNVTVREIADYKIHIEIKLSYI